MRTLKMLCCGLLLLGQAVSAKPQPLDGIAAIVNDSIITQSQLSQQVKLIEKQIKQSGNGAPDPGALEKQVLDHLILNEIQLQLAKKTGIQIDEATLDGAIENIGKDNNMTVTQLREALTQEGIDYNHYRTNIRHQMMISQLQQRDIMHDVQVSDHEVKQFLQSPNGLGGLMTEYRLGHILIPLSESPSPEEIDNATKQAQQVIAKLRQGKDFAQIALTESKGEQALNGGDLGWRKLPEIPTLFEKAVPKLKVNEVADPVRSASGLHIIKLLDKRSAAAVQQTANVGKTLVRHILIKTNAVTSDSDAKQKLAEIKQKISEGADFAQLAKAHSADLGSSSNGGSLGWVSKDVLVPEFSQVMENLTVQELSEPFKTSFGWHIVQVMDRKTVSEDEASFKQKAKQMLQQRKYEEKLQTWARQLRDESYVKTYHDSLS